MGKRRDHVKETIKLDDLVGEYWLSGVDFIDETRNHEPAQHCDFVLDGMMYRAEEDPSDGYRSCMNQIVCRGPIKATNSFKGCRVKGVRIHTSSEDVVSFKDADTGVEVLRIGTVQYDEYYPSFVAEFHPEHMSAFEAEETTEPDVIEEVVDRGPEWGLWQ